MARTNAVMTRTQNGNIVSWVAADKSAKLDFDRTKISATIADALFWHGVAAKIGDAAAKSEATTAEKFTAMAAVRDNLYAGTWSAKRGSDGGNLADALQMVFPKKSREEIVAVLARMSDKEKRTLRTEKSVRAALEKIEEDGAKASGVDASKLLAGFK